jgi:hypothetical protein
LFNLKEKGGIACRGLFVEEKSGLDGKVCKFLLRHVVTQKLPGDYWKKRNFYSNPSIVFIYSSFKLKS